jgi:hypothetical protein
VCPAPLPYQGKLPVHEGTSLCSLPAVVHRGRGQTPWRSLTLTGLCKMSLWLLSPPSQLCRLGLPSIARLCLLLTLPIPLTITLVSAQYMYYLRSQYKMLINKIKNKKLRKSTTPWSHGLNIKSTHQAQSETYFGAEKNYMAKNL